MVPNPLALRRLRHLNFLSASNRSLLHPDRSKCSILSVVADVADSVSVSEQLVASMSLVMSSVTSPEG